MGRFVFGLLAVAVVAFVVFVVSDPSYQRMREDAAFHQAEVNRLDVERRQLELDERRAVSPAEISAGVLLRVGLPVLGLVALVVLGDVYYLRRRPLVRPDDRGLLPVARDELLLSPVLAGELARLHHEVAALRAVYQLPVPAALNYAPRLDVRAAEGPALPVEGEHTGPLPSAPSWAALLASGFRTSTGRVLLGYAAAGPVYGPISGLLSTAIAGRPGQGKSTLLRFIYAQVMMLGGRAVVWDLHGSIADDVAGGEVCEDVGQVERSAAQLLGELERRRSRRQLAAAPVLVLVDEWPALSLASRSARSAVGKIVLEGRKYGLYALIAGQGLPADQFGGSLVRDALSSRYVFRTSAAQARMAGLEKEHAGLLVGLRPGLAVLAGPVDPQVVAVPDTTVADLQGLVSVARAPAPVRASGSRSPARGGKLDQASFDELLGA